jgi:hypothetical protein
MTNKNTNPTGMASARQFSIAHSASSRKIFAGRIKSIVMALLLFPTMAFSYPFHLTWTDINADEDGTIVYRQISGVFHEVGFVGPDVRVLRMIRRGRTAIHFAGPYGRFGKLISPAPPMKSVRACPHCQSQDSAKVKQDDRCGL